MTQKAPGVDMAAKCMVCPLRGDYAATSAGGRWPGSEKNWRREGKKVSSGALPPVVRPVSLDDPAAAEIEPEAAARAAPCAWSPGFRLPGRATS